MAGRIGRNNLRIRRIDVVTDAIARRRNRAVVVTVEPS
jgi:hypothetical protein